MEIVGKDEGSIGESWLLCESNYSILYHVGAMLAIKAFGFTLNR